MGNGYSAQASWSFRGICYSGAQIGCLDVHSIGALREQFTFAINSEWVNEAFELHAHLPHTVRFLGAAEPLLTPSSERVKVSGRAWDARAIVIPRRRWRIGAYLRVKK